MNSRLALPLRLACRLIPPGHVYQDENDVPRFKAMMVKSGDRDHTLAMLDAFPPRVRCCICHHVPAIQRNPFVENLRRELL